MEGNPRKAVTKPPTIIHIPRLREIHGVSKPKRKAAKHRGEDLPAWLKVDPFKH
jgi:hypothetical protein